MIKPMEMWREIFVKKIHVLTSVYFKLKRVRWGLISRVHDPMDDSCTVKEAKDESIYTAWPDSGTLRMNAPI